jgi:hypothetical protein
MKHSITTRYKLFGYAAAVALTILVLRMPAVQNVMADALVEFLQVTERTFCIPCEMLHHDHCFSLDRFDSTCPQCF